MPITIDDYLGIERDRAEVIGDWAFDVIRRWIREIKTQEIKNPSALIRSLHFRVYNASGGDKTRIVFTLLNYGRFADLGVGRGEFQSTHPYRVRLYMDFCLALRTQVSIHAPV